MVENKSWKVSPRILVHTSSSPSWLWYKIPGDTLAIQATCKKGRTNSANLQKKRKNPGNLQKKKKSEQLAYRARNSNFWPDIAFCTWHTHRPERSTMMFDSKSATKLIFWKIASPLFTCIARIENRLWTRLVSFVKNYVGFLKRESLFAQEFH